MSFLKSSSGQLLLGVFVAMGAAYFLPWEWNALLDLQQLVFWGIVGIFFFYGLKLDTSTLFKDISNWRLHLLIQSITFVAFPLCIVLFYPFFMEGEYYRIWLSVFFLAALPSTVSSSVIMTSVAKGNIPSAVFNATLTGLVGLLITPLWVGLFLAKSNVELDALAIIWDLVKQLLLPLALGLSLSKLLRKMTDRIKPALGWFDKIIIFIIIYKSFSAAFTDRIFADYSWTILLTLATAMSALFFLIYFITNILTKRLHFSLKDQIAALFSATQKSLVHGSVFVIILVPDATKQSYFLLAVMIYHSLQLVFCSYLAGRFGRRSS